MPLLKIFCKNNRIGSVHVEYRCPFIQTSMQLNVCLAVQSVISIVLPFALILQPLKACALNQFMPVKILNSLIKFEYYICKLQSVHLCFVVDPHFCSLNHCLFHF
ncbi:hypothetical protein GDO86_005718 [Hymenochirus boettgeri]|uniref:Uncharacterized protein n=1 Tax=Hymenochirus boettgeri TaxID=247094 RepID=A0A8T2J864_9PIPI|nr:hypothetical protein GDO86_005718 [Hymenochirus boettgeri]